MDYIDLMLLHQPVGDINAWKGLEKLYKDGKLRAIGMANCYPHILADLCETFEIRPMVNQVEMHPFFQQQLNLDTMKEYGVVPEAWAPFDEGKRNFFRDPVRIQITAGNGASPTLYKCDRDPKRSRSHLLSIRIAPSRKINGCRDGSRFDFKTIRSDDLFAADSFISPAHSAHAQTARLS